LKFCGSFYLEELLNINNIPLKLIHGLVGKTPRISNFLNLVNKEIYFLKTPREHSSSIDNHWKAGN